MAGQGVKLIEVLGQSDGLYYLYIDPEGQVSLEDASHYQLMGNYAFSAAMRQKYGEKIAIMSIGQAGERQYKAASIQVTEFGEGYPSRGGNIFENMLGYLPLNDPAVNTAEIFLTLDNKNDSPLAKNAADKLQKNTPSSEGGTGDSHEGQDTPPSGAAAHTIWPALGLLFIFLFFAAGSPPYKSLQVSIIRMEISFDVIIFSS